jgi:peptidoglycan/LPS O-acetylase OafA/YrhL
MSAPQGRIHYVDWLRVLAVLLLFPFHTLRVFNAGEAFYIKAPTLSLGVNYLLAFIDRWHMPLLFLLAGASTLFAMRKRTTRQYVGERVMRLAVPFVLGVLLVMPPQTYVGGRFNSGYAGSYLSYITSGDFLVWNIRDGGDYYGGLGIGHLWFVLWLLGVSLLALPLIAWSRGDRGGAWLRRWGARLSHPAWWLLPPALIWLGDGLPDVAGKNPFYYLVFFLLGMAAFADPAFGDSAERLRWPALVAGSALTVAYLITGSVREGFADPSVPRMLADYTGFLGTWLIIVGLLGIGRRYLDRNSAPLAYLAEASYPLYILHQTVIVLLAVAVVGLPLVWQAQAGVLLVGAVVVTFGLYEAARRFTVTRFVLGMRRKPA